MTTDQQEHYSKLEEISNNHSIMLDTTIAGGGKTIFPLVFSHRKQLRRVIVFCHGTLHVKHWLKHKELHDSPIINIITYDQLRGSSSVQQPGGRERLQHGLLTRLYGDTYEPSDLFKMYVEEGGLLIICDECHLIKNEDCGKTEAVKTLTRYLVHRNTMEPYPISRSYVYFSSMTPFDDMDHVINFGYLSGVIRSNSLYDRETGAFTGIMDLYHYCNYFDNTRTAAIWGTSDVKIENIKEIAYRLLADVYLRLVSSFVKDCHKNFSSKQSIYYAYFDVEEIGVELMKRSLEMIKSKPKNTSEKLIQDMVRNQESNLINNFNKMNISIPMLSSLSESKKSYDLDFEFAKITNNSGPPLRDRSGVMYGTMTSQSIKTYYASLKFIQHIFNTVPNVKVVVFLNYKESVDIIMRFLSHLNPVAITGEYNCNEVVRNSIIEKFQQPNLDSRLILLMSQIGSDGIELDDKDGNFPRVSIGLPDFYNSRYFQCPGRTYRRFTKSNSLYFFIMINSPECSEESLDKSINTKSKIMIDTLKHNEIIPPMNFDKIYNPDKINITELLETAGKRREIQDDPSKSSFKKIVKIISCSMAKNF